MSRILCQALASAAVGIPVLAACCSPAHAANATWIGSTSGLWSTAGNWNGGAPGSTSSTTSTDIATFNSIPTNSTLSIDANRNIRSLLFTGSAGAFTIGSDGVNGGNALLLTSSGSITVSTALAVTNIQTINAPLQIQGADSTYTFDGSGIAAGSLLSINGDVSAAAAGTTTLTLQGSNTGSNTVAGVIGNGSATTFNVSKRGAGQWVLTGSNTYSGSTSVTAGTLTLAGASGAIQNTSGLTVSQGATFRLDNSTNNNTDRVSDTAGLTLNGGGFTFAINTTAGSFSETVGMLTANAGMSTINTSQAATDSTSTLTFASLNRSAGAGINFAGTSLGGNTRNRILFTTAPTVTNGIIGPWAIYNGTDYATYGDNGVAAASYSDISALGSSIADSGTANVRLNSSTGTGNIALGATTTSINTLLQNQNTAAIVDTASKTLRVAGIMVGSGSKQTLRIGINPGDGTVTPLTDGGELVLVGNNTNALTVNAVITDNGSASSVTKLGGNTVILAGNNTYTGTTTVASGTLQFGSSGTTGSVAGDVVLYQGATLAYNRTNASSPIGGGLVGQGGNITVNSGTMTVAPKAGDNSFGVMTLASNTRLVINGDTASTNTFNNNPSMNGAGNQLEFASGSNSVPGSFFIFQDNRALYFTGGTTTFGGNHILAYNSGYSYGLVANGGRFNTSQMGVGFGGNSIGVLDVTGTFGLTAGGGGVGLNLGIGNGSIGVYNQSQGATVTTVAGIINVGQGAGGRGEFNLSGGTFGSSGGSSGNNAYNLTITSNASATGLVNLTGGSLYVRAVNTALNPSRAFLNFNGGTLVANQTISWGTSNGLITVYNGGATLDDGGFALTVSQAIAAPTGHGVTNLPTISETSGYVGSPYVFISGGSGTNAAGVADYDPATGLVTGIRLTNPGTDYQAGDTVNVWLRTTSGSTHVGTATLGLNVGGGLTKLGSGTLSLTGANTYTGTTFINAGMLNVGVGDVAGVSGALGNGGEIRFGGGTLQYAAASAGTDYSARIRNSGSAIAIDTNGQGVAYAGTLDSTNTDGLTKLGSGTLTLSAANTFSGTTTVTAGTLQLSNSLALQNSVLGSGGTGVVFDSAVTERAFTLGGLGGSGNLALVDSGANAIALTVGNGDLSSSYSGALSGAGSLIKIGGGRLTLSGNNTHSGGTVISAGTLTMGSATALGASTAALAVNAGTLDMNGFSGTVGTLSGSSGAVITSASVATLTASSAASSAFGGIISGAVALTKQGGGTLTLTNANTYTGTTTISGGTLALGSGGSINATSSPLVISSAAALRIGSGAIVNTSGTMAITGTSTILLESGGSLVATQAGGNVQFVPDGGAGNNTQGTLTSTGAIGTSGTMTVTASFLRPAGVNNINYTFTFDNVVVSATSSTFEVGRGGRDHTATITNGASITATNGTLAVNASNYTLNVTNGGTLSLLNNMNMRAGGGGGHALNINGGTVTVGNVFSFNNSENNTVTITNGGLLSTNANSTISATNALVAISGTGSHWNMNGRTLALGGAGVESNTVRLANGGLLTAGSVSVAAGGNAFEFDGGVLASATNGTLLSGAGTVRIKSGGATINTGTFASTISAVLLEDASSTGGGLIKTGGGRLTLTGANTFTGTTQIDAGSLIVNGALAGDVVVGSGATLGGAGVLGNVLSGAGTISVGNSPGIGTAASVDPSAGTDWVFEITGTAPIWNAGTSASVNDVLRLTDATPFLSSLTAGNAVDVLFNLTVGGPISEGTFLGGFFSDQSDFTTAIANGGFEYWVLGQHGDSGGQREFAVGSDGSMVWYTKLSAYDSGKAVSVSVVPQSVSFDGTNTVNGYSTQFVVVPEPSTLIFAGIGIAMASWSLRNRRRNAS